MVTAALAEIRDRKGRRLWSYIYAKFEADKVTNNQTKVNELNIQKRSIQNETNRNKKIVVVSPAAPIIQ